MRSPLGATANAKTDPGLWAITAWQVARPVRKTARAPRRMRRPELAVLVSSITSFSDRAGVHLLRRTGHRQRVDTGRRHPVAAGCSTASRCPAGPRSSSRSGAYGLMLITIRSSGFTCRGSSSKPNNGRTPSSATCMNDRNDDAARILATVCRYYTDRLRQFGATPQGVDWNSADAQALRFSRLLELLPVSREADPPVSLIDYGCGYGALADYLAARGGAVTYCGFDVSADMIAAAEARHPSTSARSYTPTSTRFILPILSGQHFQSSSSSPGRMARVRVGYHYRAEPVGQAGVRVQYAVDVFGRRQTTRSAFLHGPRRGFERLPRAVPAAGHAAARLSALRVHDSREKVTEWRRLSFLEPETSPAWRTFTFRPTLFIRWWPSPSTPPFEAPTRF